MVKFDASMPGTPEQAWLAEDRLADRPAVQLDLHDELVVVAAHPDDETFGAGLLIAEAAKRGMRVRVVVVTDGAAARTETDDLVAVRCDETTEAVATLASHAEIEFLAFPDGQTREHRREITGELRHILQDTGPQALLAAPWRGDGHRDHRIVGEIMAEIAGDRTLLEYPIWMWHWAHPARTRLPWDRLEHVAGDGSVKRRALDAFRSQTSGTEPVVRPDMLEHFRRDTEVFFSSDRWLGTEYFGGLYDRRSDPWRYETRWYEQRKRALTMASLPRRRYRRALEIGCSTGALTEELASRCDEVIAIDLDPRAIATVRGRGLEGVTAVAADALVGLPDGPFDLIVLSEVGYYWGASGMARIARQAREISTDDAHLLACHWRRPVEEREGAADVVHSAIRRVWERIVEHREPDVVLEVFGMTGESVAQEEGFA
ncbi:MAG TPA: PIG-L family deacetylase [Microbacterium sp.]|nr:PIG-L family deacetylase [Microbacterium sp.]